MARPTTRSSSSFLQFRQRIPADVLAKAHGRALAIPIGDHVTPLTIAPGALEMKLSLRTRDPSEAKARQAGVLAYLEQTWRHLRAGPRPLSLKRTVALAGEVYRVWTAALEDDPGSPALWQQVRMANVSAATGTFGRGSFIIGPDTARSVSMEERFGPWADWTIARHSLVLTAECRTRLVEQIATAMDAATAKAEKNAAGDYRPDAEAARFPEWTPMAPSEGTSKAPLRSPSGAPTLLGLVDGWWAEAKARNLTVSTRQSYAATVAKLVAFLGHQDASRVTPDDLIRFKDYRLASINPRSGKSVSPKTVKDSDLAALKAIFGWALANRKVAENPAAGVTMKVGKATQLRSKGFTDAEAAALLAAAFHYRIGKERPKTAAAKRWVPWICAFTGARAGELVQLRQEDVYQDDGCWVIRITPEAGTVKGKEARVVALHPQLVAQGFPRFAHAGSPGYLFISPGPNNAWRGPWQGVKNRLQEFARETVSDLGVAPIHGWRHRFKTVGRRVGIGKDVLDHICGHTPASVGDSYGNIEVAVQHREIAKMPNYPEGAAPLSADLISGTPDGGMTAPTRKPPINSRLRATPLRST